MRYLIEQKFSNSWYRYHLLANIVGYFEPSPALFRLCFVNCD